MHAPSQPLMRSLLSQFQTPTGPRRLSRIFRVWKLVRLPVRAVKQMMGEYKCRSSRLYSLNWTCRKLACSLGFSISHIPRADNSEANALANSAVRK